MQGIKGMCSLKWWWYVALGLVGVENVGRVFQSWKRWQGIAIKGALCTFAQVTLRSMTWCIEHYCKFHISFAIVANRQWFVVNEFPNQDWVGSHFRRKKWNLGEANPHVYYPWDTGTGDVEALWSVGNVSLRCASPWHWIYLAGTLRVQWWLWGTKRSPKFNACLCCARFWRS